jgi:hypothetical protein
MSHTHRASVVAITVLAVLVVLALVGCGGNQRQPLPASGSSSATSSTASGETSSTSYIAVTLTDGSAFFGVPKKSDPSVLFLDDAYFLTKKGSAAGSNTLRRFGSEVHAPYSAVIIPTTSVLYEQPLTGASAAVQAIRSFESKSAYVAAPSIDQAKNRPYAVFLKDSEVVFGKIAFSANLSLTVSNAYYLSYKNPKAARIGQIKSLSDVTLVQESQTAIGPTGDVIAPLTSVMYFQPLTDASPVLKAMAGNK